MRRLQYNPTIPIKNVMQSPCGQQESAPAAHSPLSLSLSLSANPWRSRQSTNTSPKRITKTKDKSNGVFAHFKKN